MKLSPRTGCWLGVLSVLLSAPAIGFCQVTPEESGAEVQTVEQNPDLTLQQQQSLQEIMQIRQRLGGGLTEQLQDVLGEESSGNFGESLKRLIRQPPSPGGRTGRLASRPVACQIANIDGPLKPGDRVDLVQLGGKQKGKTVLSAVEIAAVRGAVHPLESDLAGDEARESVQLDLYLDTEQNRLLERYDSSQAWVARRTVLSPPTAPAASRGTGQAGHRPSGLDRFSPARIERLRQAARDLERVAADLEDLEMYHDADNLRRQAQQLRTVVRLKNDTTDIMQRQGFHTERR
ncbi:MAG: hypothetical protein MK108_08650 [Mariniblastus sp.]|nr:hypothetical protein [Mariniblastus sp.]